MSQLAATEAQSEAVPPERILPQLVWYFLRLGTWGFGGPIALAGYMQRDLVEENGWFTRQEYLPSLLPARWQRSWQCIWDWCAAGRLALHWLQWHLLRLHS